MGEVVGRESDRDRIARDDLDVEFAKAPGQPRRDLVTVVQIDGIVSSAEDGGYHSVHASEIVATHA